MSIRQLSIQWKFSLLSGLCLLSIVALLVGLSLYRMDYTTQLVEASSTQMLNESAKARIPSPNNSAIQEIWSETVTSIFVDGADVAQALHDAAARIDEQLS